MHIVSVINYKGGVGKTTLASNISAILASKGQKVLLMDMDAQASLTFSFVSPEYWSEELEKGKTIKEWFDSISTGEAAKPLVDLVFSPTRVTQEIQGSDGSVDLIASHLGLINVDLELATLLSGSNMTQSKKNYIKVHGRLRDELRRLADRNSYDLVLIDCPPNFNIVTKNAIVASDYILIPAKPDHLSTLGIEYLKRSVTELVQDFNEYAQMDDSTNEVNPRILGVVFTMIQIYNGKPVAAQRQYIAQTKRLGLPVFKSVLRENKTIFAGAPQEGVPVGLNSYSNYSHSDIVSELSKLAEEFASALKS